MQNRIDKSIVLKSIVYGGVIVILSLLQTTIFTNFTMFGAKPDIIFAAVIAISMFEGEKFGAIMGVVAGFIIESIGGWGIGILPLFYMVSGFVCGICTAYIFRKSIATWCIYALTGYFARAIITIIYILAFWRDYTLWDAISKAVAPEYLYSILLSPLIFFIIKLLAHLFHKSYELKN